MKYVICSLLIFIILLFIYRPHIPQALHFIGRKNLYSDKEIGHRALREAVDERERLVGDGEVILLGDSLSQRATFKNVINLGVGYDTIKDLSERIKSYKSLTSAKLLIIQIGTNDAGSNEFRDEDVDELFKSLPSVPTIFYAMPPFRDEGKEPERVRINNLIKSKCKDNCRFIDLSDKYKSLGDSAFTEDGVHLSKEGYRIWEDSLREVLK